MIEPIDFYDALALGRDGVVPSKELSSWLVRISEHTVRQFRRVNVIDLEVHAEYLAAKRARKRAAEVEQLNQLYYCDAVGEA